jgi:hypothetical protein
LISGIYVTGIPLPLQKNGLEETAALPKKNSE